MSNGRGTKDKNKKAGPMGRLKKLTPAENELDSYNKFVEKVADSLGVSASGLGKRAPEILTKAVLSQPPVQRFKRPTKKPVLDSSGKPVKNLVQDMAGGGEVLDLSTEMVIDE